MSEMNIKAMSEFSKKVVPRGWEPLIIGTEEGLIWLGRENLLAMRADWMLQKKSFEVTIKSTQRMNRKYHQGLSTKYYRQVVRAAEAAIAMIDGVLDMTTSKPVLCYHRTKPSDFELGETVFIGIDGTEDGFVPGVIESINGDELMVWLGDVEGTETEEGCDADYGQINFRSHFVLRECDVCYLLENPKYLEFFARALCFNEGDTELYISLVEGCLKYYEEKGLIEYADGDVAEVDGDVAEANSAPV